MAENSDGTNKSLDTAIKYHNWVPVRSPGLAFYANEILAGRPFTFVRYGEGEWRFTVPALPEKTGTDGFWRLKEAQDALRYTVTHCHNADRYFPALWHQRYLNEHGWLKPTIAWLSQQGLDWIKWHDGRVWRRAIEQDQMHVIVRALREQGLPVVIVGPKWLSVLASKLKAQHHIRTHPREAYWDRATIERDILNLKKPSLICFSVGCNAKMLIHSLWPRIGEHSFMIDFGASWDGLCGNKSRPYHRPLTPERIRKNWEGK